MCDRIGHQIGEHPNQRPVAADHPDRLRRQVHLQCHAGAFGGDGMGVQHIAHHLVEGDPFVGRVDGAGVDLGHLEEVVDHLGEPNALVFNAFGLGSHLVAADHAVADRLGERPDPGQRSAQVVADEGDQLPAGLFGHPFGIADLLLPHHPPGLVAGQHHRRGQRHHRDDHQDQGNRLERGVGHEPAGEEHPGEGGQRGDQHQRHHAQRQRPRAGQPDHQRTDQHHRKRTAQCQQADLGQLTRCHAHRRRRRHATDSHAPRPSAGDAGRRAWTAGASRAR